MVRTHLEKLQLAAEIVDYLNEVMQLDHDAIATLVKTRVPCNQALIDHPTIQVSIENGVGLMGIINGFVGSRVDGSGYVAAAYDDSTGKLTHFQLTS